MAASWRTVLSVAARQLNGNQVEWMLLGSAATALRGVAIGPGDTDIAVGSSEDVGLAAELLPTPDVQVPQDNVDPSWISTAAAPTLPFGSSQEQWTFGRWIIADTKVELAHIDSPDTAARSSQTAHHWNGRGAVGTRKSSGRAR